LFSHCNFPLQFPVLSIRRSDLTLPVRHLVSAINASPPMRTIRSWFAAMGAPLHFVERLAAGDGRHDAGAASGHGQTPWDGFAKPMS